MGSGKLFPGLDQTLCEKMDLNTKIAGELTIRNWKELKATLERDLGEDAVWDEAYGFFEKRINTRYLNPIEVIEKNLNSEGEGFAISAIICSLIEVLETFRKGLVYRKPSKENPLDETKEYYRSQPIFESFLKNREPFKAHFATGSLADDFYRNVRCALLHEAATRGGWKIQTNTTVLIEERNEALILNRVLFVDAIKQYMLNTK